MRNFGWNEFKRCEMRRVCFWFWRKTKLMEIFFLTLKLSQRISYPENDFSAIGMAANRFMRKPIFGRYKFLCFIFVGLNSGTRTARNTISLCVVDAATNSQSISNSALWPAHIPHK